MIPAMRRAHLMRGRRPLALMLAGRPSSTSSVVVSSRSYYSDVLIRPCSPARKNTFLFPSMNRWIQHDTLNFQRSFLSAATPTISTDAAPSAEQRTTPQSADTDAPSPRASSPFEYKPVPSRTRRKRSTAAPAEQAKPQSDTDSPSSRSSSSPYRPVPSRRRGGGKRSHPTAFNRGKGSMGQTYRRLMHLPMGEIINSPDNWEEASDCVKFWSRCKTEEGVVKTWQMLDRLVEEAQQNAVTEEKKVRLCQLVKMACKRWSKTGPCAQFTPKDVTQRIFPKYVDLLGTLLKPVMVSLSRTVLRAATLYEENLSESEYAADAIMQYFQKQRDAGDTVIQPTLGLYSDLIYVYTQCDSMDSGDKSEAVLKLINQTEGVEPTVDCYTNVITAHAHSGKPGAAKRAEALLEEMTQVGLTPDITNHNATMNAIARGVEEGSMERAEEFLKRMEHLSACGSATVKPNGPSYNIIASAYAKQGQHEKAGAVLKKLQEKYIATQDPDLKPNNLAYNTLLSSLSKDRETPPSHVEELLQKMHDLAASTGNEGLRPDRVSFNAVLNAWSKSGEPYAAQRAEAILQRMQDLYESGMKDVRPNVISFSTVLDSWAKSDLHGASKRAEAILHRMIELFEGGRDDLKPNVYSFTTVIDAIAKSGERDAPERAEHIVKLMKKHGIMPNRYTYSALMTTWARSKRKIGPKKAKSVLKEMSRLADGGYESLRPDYFMFTNLLNAYTIAGLPKEAEEVLQYMEKEYKEGNIDMKPNASSHGAILAAWSRSKEPDAFERAISIFRSLLEAHQKGDPDMKLVTPTFNAFLTVLSRKRDPKNAGRAETILSRMKSLYAEGDMDCKPNNITYSCVINAVSASGHPMAAEKALGMLKEMHESNDRDCKPSGRTYLCVMRAIRNSDLDDKAELAAHLLKEIEERGVPLHKAVATEALLCCVGSRNEPLKHALDIWNRVNQPSSNVVPDSIMIRQMLKVCTYEQDMIKRQKHIEAVCKTCRDRGIGDVRSVRRLLKRFAPDQYELL